MTDAAGTVKRWWFVVHAPENVLLDLDNVWGQLQLQTGWKSEPCYKPLQLIVDGLHHRRRKGGAGGAGAPPIFFWRGQSPPQYFRPDSR